MSLFGSSKRVLLCICDGMGFSENRTKNAVFDASTPTLDKLYKEYPFTTIIPGGENVGLPKGVAGNSEVGHMNLGAGRPVRQDLVRINEAIANDTLKDRPEFKSLIKNTKASSNRLHLMTLLSDGGVHSHINHLKSILNTLEQEKDLEIYLHAFMDGRDTPKTNGLKYLKEIENYGGVKIASVQGRSIGMDRDRRWEKIELAINTMTGHGTHTSTSPTQYIQDQYSNDIYDEFISPALFDKSFAIKKDDSVFFLNFRPDRAKQISLAFCDKEFNYFQVLSQPKYFLCMSPYIDEEHPEVPILFNREKVKGTLSEFLANNNLKQLKIAETEKYAHVTYFFNGGEEQPFQGEERILIESPKEIATYDLKPEMSAPKVLKSLLKEMDDDSYSLYIVNFANPDMVGHTGKYEAAVQAIEYIDHCINELSKKSIENNITMLITADHGNCDQMVYPDGSEHTSHSNSNVPFCLIQKGIDKDRIETNKKDNALNDVAPTILHILGLKQTELMTGESIFK